MSLSYHLTNATVLSSQLFIQILSSRFLFCQAVCNSIDPGLLRLTLAVSKEGGYVYPSKRVNPSWRVKDRFTSKNPGQLNARSHSKGLETIRKLAQVLLGVFTREKVNPSARVILAAL